MFNVLAIFMLGCCFAFTASSGIVLLNIKESNRLKVILGYSLLLFALLFIKDILLFIPSNYDKSFIRDLFGLMDSWVIVTSVIFITEILKPKSVNWKRVLLHFSPFILISFLFVLTKSEAVITINKIYSAVYALTSYGFAEFYGRKYMKGVFNNYSYTEGIDIKWMRYLIALLMGYLIIWIVLGNYVNDVIEFIYYLCSLLFWIIFLFFGYRQEVVHPSNVVVDSSPSESTSINSIEKAENRLNSVMVDNKMFLNPKLTINDVARALGTNRTYLSEYLKNSLETNFFNYVNSFRVEFAKELLYNTNSKLEEIAMLSGFGSLSTFQRAFDKTYHCTPNEYRNRASKSTR